MSALGVAIAALPGWRWRAGMLVRCDDEARDQIRLEADTDGADLPPGAWPDLDDPTTVAAHDAPFAVLAAEIAELRGASAEALRLAAQIVRLRALLRQSRDALAGVAEVHHHIAAAVGGG